MTGKMTGKLKGKGYMPYENDLIDSLKILNISDYNNAEWKKRRQPIVATFELTPQCNFHCIHCYLGNHRLDKEIHILSKEEIFHIIDELANIGVLHLALTGGECTIRADFPEVYVYAKKKGFLITVFTNASRMPEEMYDIFKKYPPFFVDISLYGASEETYEIVTGKREFANVIKTINNLYSKNICFGIKTPILKQNIGDFEAMSNICAMYDVPYRRGFVMTSTIDNETHPAELMIPASEMIKNEVKDVVLAEVGFKDADITNPWGERFDNGEFVPLFICNPGVNDIIVDYQGKICPCVGFRHIGISIFEKELAQIWEEFSYLKKIPATSKNKCMRCESRYFCRICPAEQERRYGDKESIAPEICNFAHAKRMYYKEHKDIEEISRWLDNNCVEGSQHGCFQ
jgi:radical SAM protein with 4Fe4S-binding SPASM domain